MRSPRANDRLLPAPHQTGQAVFPHPAFRVPLSEGRNLPTQGDLQLPDIILALIALAGRHHVLRCASRLRNKWRPFAPPWVVQTTKGPARDHHYYERLRLLPWPARPPFLKRLCRQFESSLLAMTDLPAYPSVTSQHVAHADPAGPLSEPTTVGPGSNSSAFTNP